MIIFLQNRETDRHKSYFGTNGTYRISMLKKKYERTSLKIAKAHTEAVHRRTDHTMAKQKQIKYYNINLLIDYIYATRFLLHGQLNFNIQAICQKCSFTGS
jgi:hypothetical protein